MIETVHLTNRPQGIALTSGRLYVAVRSTGSAHRGGTLRVIAPGGLDAVDPAISYSADGWAILSMTNDGLLGFRRAAGIEGTQLVPDLARVVPSAADGGTTYTFRLRPNLRLLERYGSPRRGLQACAGACVREQAGVGRRSF